MDKKFLVIMVVLIIAFGSIFIFSQKKNPASVKVGVIHPEQSREHIQEGQKHAAYNSSPPSSGPHYSDATAPAQWGTYTQEIADEVFIHNEEHGGVIITFQSSLPAEQIKKLKALFAPPYSNKKFSPLKALVTPRSKDTHPIELAAWRYTLNLDKYDETTLINFYLQHQGHSPEPTGGPFNSPQQF